jgi:hypothetical protein
MEFEAITKDKSISPPLNKSYAQNPHLVDHDSNLNCAIKTRGNLELLCITKNTSLNIDAGLRP